jgi:hypothetical protein
MQIEVKKKKKKLLLLLLLLLLLQCVLKFLVWLQVHGCPDFEGEIRSECKCVKKFQLLHDRSIDTRLASNDLLADIVKKKLIFKLAPCNAHQLQGF